MTYAPDKAGFKLLEFLKHRVIFGQLAGNKFLALQFAPEPAQPQQLAHYALKLRHGEGLDKIVGSAGLKRGDGGFQGGLSGHDEDIGPGPAAAHLLGQSHARERVAHLHVGDNDVKSAPPQQCQRFFRAGCGLYGYPRARKGPEAERAHLRLIVHNEDPGGFGSFIATFYIH